MENDQMFAAGVVEGKQLPCGLLVMGTVYGHDVEIDSGFLKFDIDGEWHYPSAFPVNRFYVYFLQGVDCSGFFDAYLIFDEWFGYGHWLMDNNPCFRRRKCEKRWDSISWPFNLGRCNWQVWHQRMLANWFRGLWGGWREEWAHHQWFIRVSELERDVIGLLEEIVN